MNPPGEGEPRLRPAGATDAGSVSLPDSPSLGPPSELRHILSRGRIRGALALLGPAFVASVAYVDPGNFATNFASGAEYGYLLVWVIVMANLMAMLVQYLTSKAGLSTRESLPELCRRAFPKRANVVLWMQAEVVAMATDLAEFVGAALGLNLVFGVPLFPAGLITAAIAFGILGARAARLSQVRAGDHRPARPPRGAASSTSSSPSATRTTPGSPAASSRAWKAPARSASRSGSSARR